MGPNCSVQSQRPHFSIFSEEFHCISNNTYPKITNHLPFRKPIKPSHYRGSTNELAEWGLTEWKRRRPREWSARSTHARFDWWLSQFPRSAAMVSCVGVVDTRSIWISSRRMQSKSDTVHSGEAYFLLNCASCGILTSVTIQTPRVRGEILRLL